MSPYEYGVYKDEEGNTQAMDGRITNVSKENIEEILEMADILESRYRSLPEYEGCFKMLGFHPTPSYPPELATYSRDHIRDLIADIFIAWDRMLGSKMVTTKLTFKTSEEENENFLRRIIFQNRFFLTKIFAEETRDIGQEFEKGRYATTKRVFRSVAT